jgi:glyoxylase-like metal-dependent hydrolase (beta-lactamase superfamily II)
MVRLVLATALLTAALPLRAQHAPPVRTEVALGVHLFQTAPYGEVGLDGNSVAIVGSEAVLVFDTNGTPAAARAVLAEIHKLTDRPVRYVVNSHWHWDHWYGTEVYREAFPGVVVIAQERGRRMMEGPAIAFNKPGVERDLPGYLASLEQREKELLAQQPPPEAARMARLGERIATVRFFLEQKKNVKHVLPELTFEKRMTLHLGDRVVEVRHEERAVTPGDAYLWLPREKLLVTGDLLVNPVGFALSCYPSGWLRSLEALDALDAATIVPGHGAPLRDEALLHATMEVFRTLLAHGQDARARGLDADAAKTEILPKLEPLRKRIAGDDKAAYESFPTYLVDWYLHRVYDELAGPLTDEIAPIPAQ